MRSVILILSLILFVAVLAVTLQFTSAQPPFRRGPGRGPIMGQMGEYYPPQPKSEEERKILEMLKELERYRGQFQNVPPQDGRLLRLLVEAINAKHVVEIGTSNGYSGLWICLGLRTTGGKLTTFEIDPYRVSLARENFKKAGVDGMVTVVQGDAHEEVKKLKEPIDLLFIDADKEGYLDYLEKLLPLVRPGGLILAHNVNPPSRPTPEFIKAITENPDLETIFYMQGGGMSVTLKKRG